MREELRRNTSIGNKTGIELILSVIFEKNATTCDAIRSLCAFSPSSELNYLAALYLFDDLQIIHFDSNRIEITDQGLLLRDKEPEERIIKIGELAIGYVIQDGLLNCTEIKYSAESKFIELPINAFTLSAAVFRNFLISIDAFFVINGKLIVSSAYEKCFEKQCSIVTRKKTQAVLLKQLEQQQLDGEKAELFVLEYENNKLINSGKKAKRISQIDVSAGYDILSYQSSDSCEYDCYIEVKSFHGKPHFYWSENEKKTSVLLGDAYYIYLVEIDALSSRDYKPLIIQNPSKTLSDGSWIITPQSYYVCNI